MNLARDWYFVQVGPLDPRAQTLPLPDDLMGRLLEYVARARGRPHARLPAQHEGELACIRESKLRDPSGCKTMGHTPTLMDYSRFNYVVAARRQRSTSPT